MVLIDHAEVSQFDTVLDALKQGYELPDGLVCLALTGNGFRGQRQRPWSAMRGNLHFTAYYRLNEPADVIQSALTMIPAVASAEAIMRLIAGPVKPEIKWVNDILMGGRKVSGVLTATQVTGKNVNCAVFGIGINVEQTPAIAPTPFVPEAGCLRDLAEGLTGALPELLEHLVGILDGLIMELKRGGMENIFIRYQDYTNVIGRDVRIWPEGTEDWKTTNPMVCGKVVALNQDLSLHIEGYDQPVRSGRLAFEVNCHA